MHSAFLVLLCLGLPQTAPVAPDPPPHGPGQVAKPRVFLVPARAEVCEKKTTLEENNVTVWVKRGGALTARVNVGLFFVEAGASLTIRGNCYRVVVAEGGTLTSAEGNVIHIHHARGAHIGRIRASVDHVTRHEAVAIRQPGRFRLTGTVRGQDGRPAARAKVHAFTLGGEALLTETTDAQGQFSLTTDEEVSSLAADLSPRWATQTHRLDEPNIALEMRQRLQPLKGWETVIVHGPWTETGTVDLRHQGRARLQCEEVRSLPRLSTERSVHPELQFSPDGALLLALCPEIDKGKADALLWDVATGKQLRRFALKPAWLVHGMQWSAFSPDGKLLALVGPNGIVVHRLPGGDRLLELPNPSTDHHCLAFSPDGWQLAVGGDREICVWDLDGKRVRRRLKGHEAGTTCLAFSPDGKSLLSGGQVVVVDGMVSAHVPDRLKLWDLASGRELANPPGQEGRLAFSATGLIFSAGMASTITREGDRISWRQEELVSLVNPATQQEVLRLNGKGRNAAFSADGRLIVTLGRKGLIQFWEARTGQEALTVPIPEAWTQAIGLSPNGRMLATSRVDNTILLWDLGWDRLRLPEEPLAFRAADRERHWKDLGADAAVAYDVVWRLSKAGEPAMRLLKERLQPTPARDLPIGRWIQELDSPQFRVREAAARELTRHGRVVEAALREAQGAKAPLEVRRRLEAILAEVERRQLTAEELRQMRGIAALEWIGTPEARQHLKALAAGWPHSLQTQEAAAALRRLSR